MVKSWDPFRDLLTIQDRMNKLFETVLTGPAPLEAEVDSVGIWRPAAEVVETQDTLEIDCDLAGLERDQVEVRIDGQVLVVQGERLRPVDAGEWNFHRLERPYGKFQRRFELPAGLDLDHVRASLEDGVLRVSLPKRPEARPRPIRVDGDYPDH